MKKVIAIISLCATFSTMAAGSPVFTMECSWGMGSVHTQTFSVYKDKGSERLEISPTSENAPRPVYYKGKKGGFISVNGKKYFKDFYWMKPDTRLTLLRGDETRVIIESVSDPSQGELEATCSKPIYR